MPTNDQLRKTIRARLDAGESLREVARSAQMYHGDLSRWLQGQHDFGARRLKRLADSKPQISPQQQRDARSKHARAAVEARWRVQRASEQKELVEGWRLMQQKHGGLSPELRALRNRIQERGRQGKIELTPEEQVQAEREIARFLVGYQQHQGDSSPMRQ